MKILLLVLASFVFIMSCTSNATREYTADNFRVELTRTECFGKCPSFTLSISGDGNCRFTGKKNVDKIGNFSLQISREKVAEIADAINACDFWSLDKEYTANITDLPTTYLSVKLDGRAKSIRDYYGAPESLRARSGT
jgi:hypothetical protein